MNRNGAPDRPPPTSHDWTRGAPKIAAAVTLLALACAGLGLSLVRAPERADAHRSMPDIARRIDLNSATGAELETLPAIGPRRAEAIVADRLQRGPFASIEDLDRVPGIGKGTIERIRAYVTVEPVAERSPR